MKTINITFEDEEIEYLLQKKGDVAWRQFLLNLIGYKKE